MVQFNETGPGSWRRAGTAPPSRHCTPPEPRPCRPRQIPTTEKFPDRHSRPRPRTHQAGIRTGNDSDTAARTPTRTDRKPPDHPPAGKQKPARRPCRHEQETPTRTDRKPREQTARTQAGAGQGQKDAVPDSGTPDNAYSSTGCGLSRPGVPRVISQTDDVDRRVQPRKRFEKEHAPAGTIELDAFCHPVKNSERRKYRCALP
jgi:hypothetical protein